MSSPERQPLAQYASVTGRENTDAFDKTSSHTGTTDPKQILSQQFGCLEFHEGRYDCEFYLARTRFSDHSQPIVLKVLRSDCALDSKKLELFQQEASAAAKLNHPQVVESFPAENLAGVHFARIKHHPEAETLSRLLEREGWLDIERAIEITRQIANALEYAHDCGVLHLRIEPQNVLVGSGGTVFLRDFGIDDHGGLTGPQARRARECPDHYISPEVAAEHQLDARSDLYSLGVVFYQLLTDRFPIDAEDSVGIRNKHLTHRPLLAHHYSPDTPEAISELIARMLEKDPAKRFQDVKSFRAALDNAIGNTGVLIGRTAPIFQQDQESFEDQLSDPSHFEVSRTSDLVEGSNIETKNDQPELKMSGTSESFFEESQPIVEPSPLGSLKTIAELNPEIEFSGPVDSTDTVAGEQLGIEPSASIQIEREPWESPSIIGIEPEIPPNNSSSRIEEQIREIEGEATARRAVAEIPYSIDRLSFDPIAQTNSIGRFNPVFLVIVLTAAILGGVFVLARFEQSKANAPQDPSVVRTPEKPAAESTATAPNTAAAEPTPNAAGPAAPTKQSIYGSHSTNRNTKAVSGGSPAALVRSRSTSMSKRSQRTGTPKKQWRRPYRRFGTYYFDR